MLYACGQESPLGVWKSVNIGRERGNTKFSGVSFYRARWIIVSVVVEYGNISAFLVSRTRQRENSQERLIGENGRRWKEVKEEGEKNYFHFHSLSGALSTEYRSL